MKKLNVVFLASLLDAQIVIKGKQVKQEFIFFNSSGLNDQLAVNFKLAKMAERSETSRQKRL